MNNRWHPLITTSTDSTDDSSSDLDSPTDESDSMDSIDVKKGTALDFGLLIVFLNF
jgi:hypothetical protein